MPVYNIWYWQKMFFMTSIQEIFLISYEKQNQTNMFTNLERLQRQKAKVGEEKACCLELLRRRRGFAVCLWVRETPRLPNFIAVPLQGVLIVYLLGHQNAKLVMLNFQLKRIRGEGILFKTRGCGCALDCINSAINPQRASPTAQILRCHLPMLMWKESLVCICTLKHWYQDISLENELPFY